MLDLDRQNEPTTISEQWSTIALAEIGCTVEEIVGEMNHYDGWTFQQSEYNQGHNRWLISIRQAVNRAALAGDGALLKMLLASELSTSKNVDGHPMAVNPEPTREEILQYLEKKEFEKQPASEKTRPPDFFTSSKNTRPDFTDPADLGDKDL